MTEQPKDGGAAFPGPVFTRAGHKAGESMGMSLRDWFAGQALMGHISYEGGGSTFDLDARAAYKWADAMIAAREATQ